MNIGAAAEKSGLPPKTIRYYEEIGLLKADRAGNGYRDYSMADVHRLRFLQRSRSLGFSVEECRQLLSLYGNKERESAEVKRSPRSKLRKSTNKIASLQACATCSATSFTTATATIARIARSSTVSREAAPSSEAHPIGIVAGAGSGVSPEHRLFAMPD